MSRDEELKARLIDGGLSEMVADAALELDATIQRWRRRAIQRRPERLAIKVLKLDLDVAQLDVLTAIWAPSVEYGPGKYGTGAGQETMVATVAKRLGIDPSRASRLISELIEAGFAKRDVSQSDARRTIVVLNERGEQVVRELRAFKIRLVGEFLSDWDAEDIKTFLPLMERFSEWSGKLKLEGTGDPD